MASIRDWPGDVTALAVGHVIGTVIVARAARASGRVCPASHSIIVTMGFASPATVLLWVLALRPSAGTDAIRTSFDSRVLDNGALERHQVAHISKPMLRRLHRSQSHQTQRQARSLQRCGPIASLTTPLQRAVAY